MRRLILLSFLLIAILPFAISQGTFTQSIRGTVIDAVTGYPLMGTTILLVGSEPKIGTITDASGNFEMREIPVGRQAIEISYVGYLTQTIDNLLLTSAKEIVVQIQLEESAVQMEEVVISAEKKKEETLNEMAIVSSRTFSVEETERFAGSLGDPARMVANYAGVKMNSDSRNDIIIRGNSPTGVLWRIEGVEIPNPNHFGALGTTGGPVSMINNNLLTNSDFLTGAFPAEYGNAIAGAFDLNMRSGNNQVHEFIGQVGFNGFELGAEGPIAETGNGQKASYLANFRYSTLEVMDMLGFSVGTGTAVPEYQDFTFMIDVPGTRLGRLKVFGLWGNSHIELGRDLSDTAKNTYNYSNTATDFGSNLTVIGAKHTYFFTENTRLQTTLSYQLTGADAILDSVDYETPEFKPWIRSYQNENKFTFSLQLRHKLNSRNNFNLGLVADYYYFDYLDSIYREEDREFRTTADTKGNSALYRGYGQWLHNFSNQLTAYTGIHFQYFSLNNEFAIEPRFMLKWQPLAQHSFTVGFGMHSQIQPRVEYFYQSYDPETNTYSNTNLDLKFTRSIHYVAGHNYQIKNDLRLKTEVYYQSLYNVPVSEEEPQFSMLNAGAEFGIERVENLLNNGTGYNYGVELTLEKFLSHGYYLLLTTSLFESKYTGYYDSIEYNTAFNGNYVFNLLGGYERKVGRRAMLTFDAKTIWAGGKRYVPINIAESDLQNEEVRDWDRAYDEKYSDYFRLDFRIGFKINGRKVSQEWGVDLQNITNHKNVFSDSFDSETNEINLVYQQGFMPMVLYRIQF